MCEGEGLPRRGVGYVKNRLLNKERDVCVCVRACVREGGIPRQGVENLIIELNKERDVCV